jgi:site-specific recombinase XerD
MIPRPTLYTKSGSPWWWYSWYIDDKRILRSCRPFGLRIDTHPRPDALAALCGYLGLETNPGPKPVAETIEWAREFLVKYTLRAGRRQATVKSYNNGIDHLARCFGGERRIAEFTRADVTRFQDYLVERELRPAGVNRIMRCVRRLFSVLVIEEILTRNPFARFPRMDEHNTEQRHLSAKDVIAFVAALENYRPRPAKSLRPPEFYEALKRLTYICWSLGIRRAEALGIRREHVDLAGATVAVMNVKHRHRVLRRLEIEPDVLDDFAWFLGTFPGETPFAFCNPDYFSHWVKLRFADAGLPRALHLHNLRHTFTRDALDSGTDPWTVMQHQGHVDIRTTIGYADGAKIVIRGVKRSTDLRAHRNKFQARG